LSHVQSLPNKRNPRKDQPGFRFASAIDLYWRISIFGKTPARSLGIITAPDDEAAAGTKVIEYFHIESALQFWAVATRLEKVKERANAANQPKLFGLRRTIIKTGRDG
jgi:hypothetical protein